MEEWFSLTLTEPKYISSAVGPDGLGFSKKDLLRFHRTVFEFMGRICADVMRGALTFFLQCGWKTLQEDPLLSSSQR